VEHEPVEWTFTARAATHAELLQAVRRARLPDLVGAKETCEILGIQKMTLKRWLDPDSGRLGPDKTYMIPPKRIDAGPVWVKSDVIRFGQEVGRQRARATRRRV
jgi:hypothetical protein